MLKEGNGNCLICKCDTLPDVGLFHYVCVCHFGYQELSVKDGQTGNVLYILKETNRICKHCHHPANWSQSPGWYG